jgi:hypothetical protein
MMMERVGDRWGKNGRILFDRRRRRRRRSRRRRRRRRSMAYCLLIIDIFYISCLFPFSVYMVRNIGL